MKTGELRGDLIAVGAIYILLNLLAWLTLQQQHIHQLKAENLYVKSVVIDMDRQLDNFRYMLDSMNRYADSLEAENADLHHSDRLLKDVR